MYRRGTRSWRFSHGSDQTPHALLFVRDSLGLPAGTGPANPPRLAGEVPDLTGRLDEGTRREAGEQWPAWWHDVLTWETGMDPDRRTGQFIDPPEWDSLSSRPALRVAARACYTDGCRWADAALRPLHQLHPRGEGAAIFEWHVVRDAAEATASELGADIGDINGRAAVLAVTGHWHELLAPGVALCSVSDAADPQAAAVLLREVFTSWVTR